MQTINNLLKNAGTSLYNKDYLLTWEQPLDMVKATVELARAMRDMYREGSDLSLFKSGLAVSQFRDNSTRTRFSFASACDLLGLAVSDLDEQKSQIAHGETVRETATMISFLTEVIGIRDDMYIGEGHSYMVEVGKALDESYERGVLPIRPGIVNLQCDMDHPTQSMADLSHLVTRFGGFDGLKGKKIAMTWAYSPSYGKPLSVAQGTIALLSRFGADLTLAHPKGYELMPEIMDMSHAFARESGGSFTVKNSMDEAFKDAVVIYPKSWAPMQVMEERSRLLRKGDKDGLKELEKHALALNAEHMDWEADMKKHALTDNALYMHCLPADISDVSCKHGEVSAELFEKYRLDTYEEASYKPFVIAAMIFLTRMKEPTRVLTQLLDRTPRHVYP
ncbi:knotted carbamoyltransferase YgeW [Myxococcota bacterium]|nr:knotted carbamoyltransferase YgeW [Myxococcota bacterium]